MNILKKVSAAALAAVTAASCLTAVASAEDEKPKLLVSPMSIIGTSGELATTDNGFISITDEDIKKWQTTGEFSYSDVKTDFDLPEDYSWNYEKSKNTGYLYYQNTGEDKKSLFTLKYDAKTKKLTKLKDFGTSWTEVRADGYVVDFLRKDEDKKITVTITSPEGKSKTNTFEYKGEGDWEWYWTSNGDKYAMILLWKTNEKEVTYGENDEKKSAAFSYDLYGITKDGKVETLFSEPGSNDEFVNYIGLNSGSDNCVSWVEQRRPYGYRTLIYNLDNGKIILGEPLLENYDYNLMCHYSDGFASSQISGVSNMYGDRFIAKCPVDYTTSPYEFRYILFGVTGSEILDGSYKGISDVYKYMSTEDGKIFLVQDDNDKWGYIDANGKEIAMFDDAGSFVGDYAPVIKDGKAYLIDKNMKQVSEKVDAESVRSVSDNPELFKLTIDGKSYLATFAKPAAEEPTDPSSEPTSDPTGEPTSEPSSEPTSEPSEPTVPKNPDTGVAGIGFTVALAAIGGTVMIISRKKR